ncbi:hypothetical protein K9N50_05270 [bacterium]|nr:hypothetical protein [bacterium]
MSDNNLPVLQANQQVVRKEENEEEIIEVEGREIPQPPAPSIAGQIVKAVVHSALDWLDKRLTTGQVPVNRTTGDFSSQRSGIRRQSPMGMGGKRRRRQSTINVGIGFRSGNQRMRGRKKRF